MPFVSTSPAVAPLAKFLPPAALDVFCKAATGAEQDNADHNTCIRKGWEAVADAGWRKPETGKKWVLKDDGVACGDGPTAGAVHVDAPLGSRKPKKDKDGMAKFDTEAQVFKVDDSLGLVFGWAIVCKINGEPYFDQQRNPKTGAPEPDHIPEDTMLKAAADFMQNSRVSTDMHERDGSDVVADGDVVFCFPMTTDIAKSLNISTEKTGLLIAMKPSPDVLEKFKSGDYTGFSIGGYRGEDEEIVD